MFFKLGKKATLFVDTASGKKLVKLKEGEEPQVIELDAKEMRTQRVKQAITAGHIVKCNKDGKADNDELDNEEETDDDTLISQKEFDKLKVPDMKTYIVSNFELEDDEAEEIDEMQKADLSAKFAELVEAKNGEDDDDDDDDDN